jgi:hypothetical protein
MSGGRLRNRARRILRIAYELNAMAEDARQAGGTEISKAWCCLEDARDWAHKAADHYERQARIEE